MIKKSKIKLKENQTVIFDAETGFYTDGNAIIKADLVELSDSRLQGAIYNKVSFGITSYAAIQDYPIESSKQYYTNIPPIKNIIPKGVCVPENEMCLACLQQITKTRVCDILVNKDDFLNYTFIDSGYLNIYKKAYIKEGLDLRFYQLKGNGLKPLLINNNDETVGLIMPVKVTDSILPDMIAAAAEEAKKESEKQTL